MGKGELDITPLNRWSTKPGRTGNSTRIVTSVLVGISNDLAHRCPTCIFASLGVLVFQPKIATLYRNGYSSATKYYIYLCMCVRAFVFSLPF